MPRTRTIATRRASRAANAAANAAARVPLPLAPANPATPPPAYRYLDGVVVENDTAAPPADARAADRAGLERAAALNFALGNEDDIERELETCMRLARAAVQSPIPPPRQVPRVPIRRVGGAGPAIEDAPTESCHLSDADDDDVRPKGKGKGKGPAPPLGRYDELCASFRAGLDMGREQRIQRLDAAGLTREADGLRRMQAKDAGLVQQRILANRNIQQEEYLRLNREYRAMTAEQMEAVGTLARLGAEDIIFDDEGTMRITGPAAIQALADIRSAIESIVHVIVSTRAANDEAQAEEERERESGKRRKHNW